MPDLLMPRAGNPAARVTYSAHLFRAACTDLRTWQNRQAARGGVLAVTVFFGAALLVWMMRGGEMEILVPMLYGMVAVGLLGVGVFLAHWGFYTPRRLCAGKQHQLEAERRQFIATLDQERKALQLAQAERDVLKAKLEERPLRPIEICEAVDQLIAEGEGLLDAVEETMLKESELWFDDVDRFAKRHLDPKQYDRLYAVTPPDMEEQVKFHRAASESTPVAERELAVARRLVMTNAGLRELRKTLGQKSARAA
jgi:hypothetical protein